MKKFLSEYRIELIALLVALLGIFLLVEQFDIRTTLLATTLRLFELLIAGVTALSGSLLNYLSTFSLSDLIGLILVILAAAFILWRVRVRYLRSERWLARTCPKCNRPIQRVHRNRIDRLLERTLLPQSRRYRCTNPDCGWSGLRHHEPRGRRGINPPAESQ